MFNLQLMCQFLENTKLLLVYSMTGISRLPRKPINFEVMCILLEIVYVHMLNDTIYWA